MSSQAVDGKDLPSVRRSSLGSSLAVLALLGVALSGFWAPNATAQTAPQSTPCSFPYDGEWFIESNVAMTCQGTAQTPLEIFVRNLTLRPASSLVLQHVHLVLNAREDATAGTASSNIVLMGSSSGGGLLGSPSGNSADGPRLVILDSTVEPVNPEHHAKLKVHSGGDLTIRASEIRHFYNLLFFQLAANVLLESSSFIDVQIIDGVTSAGIVKIRDNFFEGGSPGSSVMQVEGGSPEVTGNTFTRCGVILDLRDFGQTPPEIHDNTFGGCNFTISQLYGDTPQEVHNNDFIDNWNRLYPDPSTASSRSAYTQATFTGDATNNYWESHSPGNPERVSARQDPYPWYEFDAATTSPSLTAPAHPERLPRPTLAATPSVVGRGQLVSFDASGSLPSQAFAFPLESFRWDFGDGNKTTGQTATHAYDASGTFTVKLIVTDSKGLTRSLARTIEVLPNQEPILGSLAILPANPVAGTNLVADVSAVDPDDSTRSYSYAWTRNGALQGDLTGANVPGSRIRSLDTWSVAVTVTDPHGASDSASASVSIPNGAPSLQVNLQPTDPVQGQALQAVASAADPDQDSVTLTYAWSKNGAPQADLTGATVPGNRIRTGEAWGVTVKAKDVHGAEVQETKAVTVGNRAPSITGLTLTPALPTRADSLRIVATATDDDGQAVSYRYTWARNDATQGDLTTDTVPAGRLVKGDTWRVTVTPTDGHSDGASQQVSVAVQNSAPVLERVSAMPSVLATVGQTVTLKAQAQDPDGDPLAITWNRPEAEPLQGPEAKTAFDAPGEYRFSVTASDGATTTAERTLTIVVRAPPAIEADPETKPTEAPASLDQPPASNELPRESEGHPPELHEDQPSPFDEVDVHDVGAKATPAPLLAFACLLAAVLARRRHT